MTLDNLPLETEAVITTVGGEGAASLPFSGYGPDPKDKSCCKKNSSDGRSDRDKTPQL